MLRNRIASLFRPAPFGRDVVKLFSGSAVVSVISFLLLPVLTRMYSVEDFGNLQLFISVTSIFVVAASLKFELAIVMPAEKKEKEHVFVLSILVLMIFTVITFIVYLLEGNKILYFLNAESLEKFAFLIPWVIFLAGVAQASQFLLVSHKMFGFLSRCRIYQSIFTNFSFIAAGLLQPSFLVLLCSQVSGYLVFSFLVLRKIPIKIGQIKLSLLRKVAIRYKKFPLFNTPGIFLNTLSAELPVLMLAKFYDAEVVGIYMIANRLLNQPVGMFTNAISQVYYQKGCEVVRQDYRRLYGQYRSTMRKMILIAIPAAAGIYLLAPEVVGGILGQEWDGVGRFIQIMLFGKFFEFIHIPVSTSLSIINHQEVIFVLRVVSLPVRFFAMYFFRGDSVQMLWALSVAVGLHYVAINLVTCVFLRKLAGKAEK